VNSKVVNVILIVLFFVLCMFVSGIAFKFMTLGDPKPCDEFTVQEYQAKDVPMRCSYETNR
jgi:hypothetical protein